MEVIFNVQWTETSVLNLKDIYDYYSTKTTRIIAQKLIQKIISSTAILATHPKSGRKEDLLENRKEEFKFIIFKNYKSFIGLTLQTRLFIFL